VKWKVTLKNGKEKVVDAFKMIGHDDGTITFHDSSFMHEEIARYEKEEVGRVELAA